MWVGCNKSLHQSVLCIRQLVLLAVNALAVLTSTLVESAEHNHHIGLASLADGLVDEFVLRTAVAKFVIAYGDSVETLDGVAHIATGIVHNTAGRLLTNRFKQSVDGYKFALYFKRRRATSYGHHLNSILTDNKNLLVFRQVERQQTVACSLARGCLDRTVLQQHNTLSGNLTSSCIMIFRTEESLGAMFVHRGAEVETQHTAYLFIKRLQQVCLALTGCLVDELFERFSQIVVVVGVGATHCQTIGPCSKLHVESVEYGLFGVVTTAPVAYYHTIEAPVAFQDTVECYLIMTIVLVVIKVVGTHDAPCLALGDGCTEGGQIDLVKCTVTDHDIHLMAVFLVVVQRIVLHTRSHALRLQSLYIRNHHARCQQRVLAHVFEVAAGEWCAVDVHART